MASKIKSVGVVGTGVIGSSWTALFLSQGLQVLVSDPAPDAEAKLRSYLEGVWPTVEAMGLAQGASIDNYRFVGASLEKYYGHVDFIQENAPERPALKSKIIGEIDAGARPEVVIASSSSGIPSSEFIGECKVNAGRVMICHPFNPPHLMPLVECVPHPGTAKESVQTALDFWRAMGKRPVLLNHEAPGFAANRIQAAVLQEAYSLVYRGILSASDMDACITSSLGPRWALTGPFISNAMGGGGGRDGFRHILEHLGPAMDGWLSDMRKHEFKLTDESMNKLEESVMKELDVYDLETVGKERDELMIDLLRNKKKASMIV